jgi:hypothetical protein
MKTKTAFYISLVFTIAGCVWFVYSLSSPRADRPEQCKCRYWATPHAQHPTVVNKKCHVKDGYVVAGNQTVKPYRFVNECN